MNMLKKIWPIIVIFLVWTVFASPSIVRGKVPFPSDYLVNNFAPFNSYPGLAGPVKNAATPDVITQIYPWKSLTIEIWKSGSVPLWNPYSFSGTPLLANYQSAALSPTNLLYFLLPFINAWSIQVLLVPLLAGLFTFLFMRSLKVSQAGSLVSSLSFMFCGFITTWMDYGTLPYSILFLPLALFSIESFFKSKKWYFLVLLAISMPLSFFSGHFQISLYFLIFTLAYLIFKYFSSRNLKSFILNLISITLGLLMCAPQLLPSLELYQHAVRSSLFIKTEVIPWGYLSTFLAPDFLGNPVTRNDWFGHYAEWNAFTGVIPFMLAFYALRKKSSTILFFIIAGLAAILLSFQTPLVDLLIALKIPVISTSAVSRIIVLFSFSFACLSGFGFDNFLEDAREGVYRGILILLGIFILVFCFLWGVSYLHILLPTDKALVALSNLKLPSAIFFVFIISVFITSFVKGRRAIEILCIVIIFLTAFDMLRFTNKWVPFMNKDLVYPDVPISKFLKEISGQHRVFGNFGAETSTTYKIPSIEGYDPLYIGRYGELVKGSSDGLYHAGDRSGVVLDKKGVYAEKIVNLLGVKYFLNKKADDRQPWAYPIWEFPVDQFKVAYEDDSYQVFENQKVFPRAFITEGYKVVDDRRKILNQIYHDDVDLKKTVFIEHLPSVGVSMASGSAKILEYNPNNIKIESQSDKVAFLVLTDPFYPGWKATINGVSTPIYRADYALRAIMVPKGKSTVIFTYQPNSFRDGVILAGIGMVGVIGISIYTLKFNKRKKE